MVEFIKTTFPFFKELELEQRNKEFEFEKQRQEKLRLEIEEKRAFLALLKDRL